MDKATATIIGGGVIGCALAYELSKTIDTIVLLESNSSFRSENQSSRTSGVVHAGIYYDKAVSPLKARLCPRGNKLLFKLAKWHGLPAKQTGKIVLATSSGEEEYLEDVLQIARENDVPGVGELSASELAAMEPHIKASAALYVPTSGVIDATALVLTLRRLAEEQNAMLLPGNKVVKVTPQKSNFEITAKTLDGKIETFSSDYVINAAGLYADEIARMLNPDSPYEIIPVRGESSQFYKMRRRNLQVGERNIYPAPYAYGLQTGERLKIPLAEAKKLVDEGKAAFTVGMHLTPTLDAEGKISSTVTIGPAKTVGKGKEDYGTGLRDPSYFYEGVTCFFPGLRPDDIKLYQAGIMAVPKGRLDWIIERDDKYFNAIHLVGIDSPGLTACLAIAEYVRKEFFG